MVPTPLFHPPVATRLENRTLLYTNFRPHSSFIIRENEALWIDSLLGCENTTSVQIFAEPVYKYGLLFSLYTQINSLIGQHLLLARLNLPKSNRFNFMLKLIFQTDLILLSRFKHKTSFPLGAFLLVRLTLSSCNLINHYDLEMYLKRPLFSHQALQSYVKGSSPPTQGLPIQMKALIDRMISKKPSDRPSAR